MAAVTGRIRGKCLYKSHSESGIFAFQREGDVDSCSILSALALCGAVTQWRCGSVVLRCCDALARGVALCSERLC
ncbi:hypothetical protein E2C01_067800 [Portunus trituberculatus]|uniref:Uncharacterized protein n=1 Tax=Portunus trituberculatus TaxID=210409 RepID=A0A5B7HM11_PORTR|nr:hypothetical protein [Portunus trituberculatus]